MSAHFSPIIIVVMHGFTAGRNGITERVGHPQALARP